MSHGLVQWCGRVVYCKSGTVIASKGNECRSSSIQSTKHKDTHGPKRFIFETRSFGSLLKSIGWWCIRFISCTSASSYDRRHGDVAHRLHRRSTAVTDSLPDSSIPWRNAAYNATQEFLRNKRVSHGILFTQRRMRLRLLAARVATRPVFAGTSRFSACLSRVPVERLPGRNMSRFWAIALFYLRKCDKFRKIAA